MINNALRLSLLLCCLIAFGANAQSSKDAFIGTSKKALKKDHRSLAMMPLFVEPSLGMPEPYKKMILDEVLKKFGKAKFNLTSSQEFSAIKSEFEGLYPPKPSAAAQLAIDDHVIRELYLRHPVDGILLVEVIAIAAPFVDDTAVWGGAKQKIKHSGDGFLGAITGRSYQGHIAASTVRVSISDRRGAYIYSWLGGIELMMQRKGKNLEQLPPEKLWQKEKKVRQAIRYALKPI